MQRCSKFPPAILCSVNYKVAHFMSLHTLSCSKILKKKKRFFIVWEKLTLGSNTQEHLFSKIVTHYHSPLFCAQLKDSASHAEHSSILHLCSWPTTSAPVGLCWCCTARHLPSTTTQVPTWDIPIKCCQHELCWSEKTFMNQHPEPPPPGHCLVLLPPICVQRTEGMGPTSIHWKVLCKLAWLLPDVAHFHEATPWTSLLPGRCVVLPPPSCVQRTQGTSPRGWKGKGHASLHGPCRGFRWFGNRSTATWLPSSKLGIKSFWFDLESYSNVESCAKNLVVEAVEHVLSQKPM
jgi:hypothetical protein